MSDMKITNLAGKLAAKSDTAIRSTEKAKPSTLRDFAAMLQESIEERRQMALAAAMSGTTVQQQILGISDEEWKRLDIANSSLVKTDEEKESAEENTSPVSANRDNASTIDDTETISRVLGDGSTLIITMRGNQVVSTQKIAPDEIIVANPNYIAPEDGGIGAAAQKTVKRTVASMSFF